MRPRSRCPHCGHAIRWWENIPVASWLALRGRCSACGKGISARYPLVEIATGALTLLVVALAGQGWPALWALVFRASTWVSRLVLTQRRSRPAMC